MSKQQETEAQEDYNAESVEKSAGVVQSDQLKSAPRKWIIAAFSG